MARTKDPRIQKFNAKPRPIEKLAVAVNVWPEAKDKAEADFFGLIHKWRQAQSCRDIGEPERFPKLDDFAKKTGLLVGEAIAKGDWKLLRGLANAVEKCAKHKPAPDNLRAALACMAHESNIIPMTLKEIKAELKRRRLPVEWSTDKAINRICNQAGFKYIKLKRGEKNPFKVAVNGVIQ